MFTPVRSTATRMLAIAVLFAAVQTTFATGVERRNAIVDAVKKTKDAIVTIKTIRSSGDEEVTGTGVIVDDRGIIITNRHVVGSARNVYVFLQDGTEIVGDVLMAEAQYDLAVVRVKAGKTLHALGLAPISELEVGEDVIAIGHPYGYVNTVSRGIVSALGREITLPSGHTLTG